jgi:molybdenum cofactor cytidylyltransferase
MLSASLSRPALSVAVVILAAGKSSRMGFPKPLLQWNGRSFLDHVLDKYSRIGLPVWVVLGEHNEQVRSEVDLAKVHVVVNPHPELGQLSSLQIGLRQVRESSGRQFSGVVFHPVDHPAVQLSTVRTLVETHFLYPQCLLLPRHAGRRGHPALFPEKLYAELAAAPLDQGARWVVRRHPELIRDVEVPDPAVLLNVDTPEEYRRLVDGMSSLGEP